MELSYTALKTFQQRPFRYPYATLAVWLVGLVPPHSLPELCTVPCISCIRALSTYFTFCY